MVVPSYQEAERIAGALCRLRDQVDAEPFEVIVVDSSTDATAAIVRREFPDVRLVTSAAPLSAGAARNLGVQEARGSKVLFTDADVLVPDDWVARMARHLERCDLVAGPIANGTPSSLSGTVLYLLEFFRLLPGLPARCYDARFAATANVGYRREALGTKGFADASIGEDVVFHHRQVEAGWRGHVDPELTVIHRNRTAWRDVLAHQQVLGRGGHRWRSELGMHDSWALRFPPTMLLKPLAVVGWIFWRDLCCRRWGRATAVLLLSPLLLLVDLVWVFGYLRAAGEAGRGAAQDQDRATP